MAEATRTALGMTEALARDAVLGGRAEKDDAGFDVWLARAQSPLAQSDVVVDFDRDKFDPQPLQGKEREDLEVVWAERVKANPKLFNATKFRLASIETLDSGRVCLGMGVSDYKVCYLFCRLFVCFWANFSSQRHTSVRIGPPRKAVWINESCPTFLAARSW